MIHSGPASRIDGSESVGTLLSGIMTDGQTLIRQQFALLRAEIKESIARSAQAATLVAIGMLLITTGSVLIGAGCVYALQQLVPQLPFWACWAIVGALALVGGLVVFLVGKQRFTAIAPFPDKSLDALSENLSWTRNQPNSSNVR